MLVDKIKLEPGEKILVQTRRHWFIIVSHVIAMVLVALVPLLSLVLINSLLSGSSSELNPSDYSPHIIFFYSLLLVFLWVGIFSSWTNYYLDILTITDRRAILINQKGFFWRNVASFRLERMQDMNVETNGIIATMLDYGTLEFETAGDADEEFKATHIPKPGNIKSVILQASDNRIVTTPNHEHIDTV